MTHEEALALIEAEYKNAVDKHGARFKSKTELKNALLDEIWEVHEAINKRDYDGPHGVKRELAQVAAVCIKALEGLE